MAAIGKGTRVKLIKSPKGLVPIGAKGTVEEIAKPSRINISPKYLWVVFDNFKSDHIAGYYAVLPEYVKVLYDGDEKTSWEECAWKPLNVSFPA